MDTSYPGKPTSSQNLPAHRRILIVGAGSIGLKQLSAFASADASVDLYALDPRTEARSRAAGIGAGILDTGWDSLDLIDFDGVVICAPAPLHVPYASRCLKEGIPVLSEKPLSHSWDGVDDLVALARRPDAPPSGVAYVRRYHPAHERARQAVTTGELGQVAAIRIIAGQPFYMYRPDYREIYYASREQGGGCTLDFASHFIDLAQWYLGPMRSIRGYADHLVLEGVQVEDTVACSFDFESAALGSLHINQFQPLNENIIDVFGPECLLRITEPGFTRRVWRKGAADWEELPTEQVDYIDALRCQAAAFLEAIDGGPPMRTGIAEAAHTLRLCLDLTDGAC